jgi:transposase
MPAGDRFRHEATGALEVVDNDAHGTGVDRSEEAIWRRKLVRDDWIKAILDRIEPGCEIGMEACSGAHHWARLLQAGGYTVKLVAPQFVKPYVKSTRTTPTMPKR